MAGACSCESCLGKACGKFEAFEGFEAGQTAGLNALKNRWLGCVAARVALERPAGGFEAFEGFEAGQTAGLNALKNRWLGRVAARVALERPAGGFEAFEGFEAGQTARLNALKNRWLGRVARLILLRLGRLLKQRQAIVAGTTLDEAFEAWQAAQTQTSNCCRMKPLKLGKPLKHRQAIVAGTTLGNVKVMAVTKQVPHLRWSQAPWRRPGSADIQTIRAKRRCKRVKSRLVILRHNSSLGRADTALVSRHFPFGVTHTNSSYHHASWWRLSC